jgi:hypothetical protein
VDPPRALWRSQLISTTHSSVDRGDEHETPPAIRNGAKPGFGSSAPAVGTEFCLPALSPLAIGLR